MWNLLRKRSGQKEDVRVAVKLFKQEDGDESERVVLGSGDAVVQEALVRPGDDHGAGGWWVRLGPTAGAHSRLGTLFLLGGH